MSRARTAVYVPSLHDALPISAAGGDIAVAFALEAEAGAADDGLFAGAAVGDFAAADGWVEAAAAWSVGGSAASACENWARQRQPSNPVTSRMKVVSLMKKQEP